MADHIINIKIGRHYVEIPIFLTPYFNKDQKAELEDKIKETLFPKAETLWIEEKEANNG